MVQVYLLAIVFSCHGGEGIGYVAGGSGTGVGNPNFLKLVFR